MSGGTGHADTGRGPLFEDAYVPMHEWGPEAARLRLARWSYRRIHEKLGPMYGVSYRQIYKELNRTRVEAWDAASAQRNRKTITARTLARRRQNAPRCPRCGGALSSNRVGAGAVCGRCRSELWWGEKVPAMVALWNAGHEVAKIAELLSVTPGSVYTSLSQARKRGHRVEYRRHRRPKATFGQAA